MGPPKTLDMGLGSSSAGQFEPLGLPPLRQGAEPALPAHAIRTSSLMPMVRGGLESWLVPLHLSVWNWGLGVGLGKSQTFGNVLQNSLRRNKEASIDTRSQSVI